MRTLQNVLPETLSPEVEEKVLQIIQGKMTGLLRLYLDVIDAAEEAYGPEAREVIRNYRVERQIERFKAFGERLGDNSLRSFGAAIERGIAGSQELEKLEDTDTRKVYHHTRCITAEVFHALGAEDIGRWICDNDWPTTEAFNPKIKLQRTKTIMMGDDHCDHVFYVEEWASPCRTHRA